MYLNLDVSGVWHNLIISEPDYLQSALVAIALDQDCVNYVSAWSATKPGYIGYAAPASDHRHQLADMINGKIIRLSKRFQADELIDCQKSSIH